MPIKFHCSHCQAPIKAPDTHAGQTLPCPKCGQPVLVAPEAPAPPAPAAPAPPPSPPSPPEPVLPSAPEPVELDVPQIVTHDKRPAGSVPPVATPPPVTGFEPPQTPTGGAVRDVNLTDVRVVDLKIPFGSVFKFAVQFFLCNMLLGFVLWLVMMIFVALLAGLGLGLGGL